MTVHVSPSVAVERYRREWQSDWDAFVRSSKNGTFILQRDYVEYHADRFPDHSLLARDGRGRVVALLPAHAEAEVLVSHRGLTYGGFITDTNMTIAMMRALFKAFAQYCIQGGFQRVIYKPVPHIYHTQPAEEDLYCLFLHDAKLYRRDLLGVVSMRRPAPMRRAQEVARARRRGLRVEASTDFSGFWKILEENLTREHRKSPTHKLDEIQVLHRRFPDNIHLHVCREGEEMISGIVVYDSAQVAHAQYIGTSERGRAVGALDLLLHDVIFSRYVHRPFFDFGTSCVDDGRTLNEGLAWHKEDFGGRAVAHDFYELSWT